MASPHWSAIRLASIALVTIAGLTANLFAADDNAATSEARMGSALQFLASDELEGRGVGTEGLNKAADYIAAHFSKLGLKTDLFGGKPFQVFAEPADAEIGAPEKNTLVLIGPPKEPGGDAQRLELKLGSDFQPMSIGGAGKVEAPVAFAGYGITSTDPAFDEFADLDVQGKVVVMLRKIPQQGSHGGVFQPGGNISPHAFFTRKVANAAQHGAVAVLFVNDSFSLHQQTEANARTRNEVVDELAKIHQEYRKKTEPTPEEKLAHLDEVTKRLDQINALTEQKSGGFDQLIPFGDGGQSEGHAQLPVYFCLRAAVEPLIQSALGKDLSAVEQEIDSDLKPRSALLKDWTAACETDVRHRTIEIKNVIGVLEGEGPLANETIVIGAHYDHLGFGGSGSLAPWTRAIHNGADDNASGTVGLLEVAERLAIREHKPRRRIVFIAFTGEERGLKGSSYYVKNPLFPLESTIAMLNMDMVGRLKDNKLVIYGTGTASQFDGLVDELNKTYEFTLTKNPSGYGPSDHQSFYEKQVPVFHFFTDTHSDYHRPSDDVEKVNLEGMRRVVDLVTEMTLRIDAADERPTYQKTQPPAMARGGSRPRFGSMPDYASSEKGAALKTIFPGTPAARAGLKDGDVVIQMGDNQINSVEDFSNALGTYKAGDQVKVVVKRGTEMVTATVTLEPPR